MIYAARCLMLVNLVFFNCCCRASNEVKFLWHAIHVMFDIS